MFILNRIENSIILIKEILIGNLIVNSIVNSIVNLFKNLVKRRFKMDELEQKAISIYQQTLKESNSMFPALATCKTLMYFLNHDTSETFIEHSKKMTKVASTLKDLVPLSEVESVTEIFIRFATLKVSEFNVIIFIFSQIF